MQLASAVILNFSATIDLLKKRRERSSAELLETKLRFGFYPKDQTGQRTSDYRFSHALKTETSCT